jgi:hypothetical protein
MLNIRPFRMYHNAKMRGAVVHEMDYSINCYREWSTAADRAVILEGVYPRCCSLVDMRLASYGVDCSNSRRRTALPRRPQANRTGTMLHWKLWPCMSTLKHVLRNGIGLLFVGLAEQAVSSFDSAASLTTQRANASAMLATRRSNSCKSGALQRAITRERQAVHVCLMTQKL